MGSENIQTSCKRFVSTAIILTFIAGIFLAGLTIFTKANAQSFESVALHASNFSINESMNINMITSNTANSSKQHILFTDPAELDNWVIINDTVMGGRSQAKLGLDKHYLIFSGELSLQNNGGFASIRRISPNIDWSANKLVQIKVKGDGRRYQFRLRSNANMDGVAYVAQFNTIENTEQTIVFGLNDFTASFRGRVIPSAAKLNFDDVKQLGFMLADKTSGKFVLSVREIKQVNSEQNESTKK